MGQNDSDAQHDEELRRIAYLLWVLDKMPSGGPDPYIEEARAVVGRRLKASQPTDVERD
jgi:hypothetical protein